MSPFDQHLLQIDGLLNVSDEDRRPYTKMFDHVKTWLIKHMRRVDGVFDKLFVRTCSFGRYTNGLRLLNPYEFDIFFIMEFPFAMEVGLDDDRPGFVHLDLKEALPGLKDDLNYRNVHKSLNKFVDPTNGYLRRNNFQEWIGNVIKKALKSTSCTCDGYDVTYAKTEVAHNLRVRQRAQPHNIISIDFVPAISFGKIDWMRERKCAPFKDDYLYSFYAVPKAANKTPRKTNLYTFLMVNPMAEHELLWNKPNLKIVFRLLKSLLEAYELYALRSSLLTTLFLWEVKRRNNNFWDNNSVSFIFLHMLEKLCEYFDDGELPHFWVHDCNLLAILKPEEIIDYSDALNIISSTLYTYPIQPLLSLARTSKHFKIPGYNSDSN